MDHADIVALQEQYIVDLYPEDEVNVEDIHDQFDFLYERWANK